LDSDEFNYEDIEPFLKEGKVDERLRNLEWLSQVLILLVGIQLLVTVLTVLGSIITISHS
jgi:hypothetical protein